MKILTILGARPQFIKAAAVSRAIKTYGENNAKASLTEVIVHTGQHYNSNMSDVFFSELSIPKPAYHLGIGGLSHAAMTGRMLESIERVISQEKPNWLLVYGDTNSTLAGALAAVKMHIPVAHVEAGLRSHNPSMPEEINRVLTDRVSKILFCPTSDARNNLLQEGFPHASIPVGRQEIRVVGDVMHDVALHYKNIAMQKFSLSRWGVAEKEYVLCTLHRAENTDASCRLESILIGLRRIAEKIPVLLPLHPRTLNLLRGSGKLSLLNGITSLDPLPYLEMQRLEIGAAVILTDSGGVQKEAYFHGIPCITLREETEWVETVRLGWNVLVGADEERLHAAFSSLSVPDERPGVYGDGNAAGLIVDYLVEGG